MDTQTKIYFERLLTQVVENQAQSIHLSAGAPPILKTDAGLKPIGGEPVLSDEKIKDFVMSFLSEAQQSELEKNKEIVIVHNFKPQLRFKASIFYQKDNLSISLRFIPAEAKNLAGLGLEELEKIIANFSKGIIIISGPFGSGKSTVTAGIIETVNNTASKHIITIEDPIEFNFASKKSLVEQRQIGRDVVSFVEGLKFLAEEQVDIVALSEISQTKVIYQAMELAQSGRLVIFQINADSSIKTIEKIIGLFPPEERELVRSLLSENLAAVINLHLFKKIGGGNILIPEILIGSSAARTIIRDGNLFQLGNILQTGAQEGMVPLEKSLSELIQNNIISPEEAKR